MHWLLFYDVADDYMERRGSFRDAHLAHASAAHDRGELVLAGALADPVDGAVLAFACESSEVIEDFARGDPYVTGGVVTGWRIRRWVVVVGTGGEAI